jgi:hypothetical protein
MPTIELTRLPKCPLGLRAFPSNVREIACGWATVAGVNLENGLPKSVEDHPWIGCEITFPVFAAKGFVGGRITHCIVHPRGGLLFDIAWPQPVWPIQGHGYRRSHGWEVVLENFPSHGSDYMRLYGTEIAELVKRKPRRRAYQGDGTS